VGTTNEQDYLKDPTGARRFWPIFCREIDIPTIRSCRDQFFAEGVALFKKGATWHVMPKDATVEAQETRRRTDAWEGILEDYLQGRPETTIRDLAVDCLKIHISAIDMLTQKRIGTILRRMKWGKRVSNSNKKVWVPLENSKGYALC
jgi:putative DNA primase/helicase